MKKLLITLAALTVAASATFSLAACNNDDIIYVDTNAFFAPFEYYDGDEIKGVDVDIMELVGKKLNKEVVITNTDFDLIIDNVAKGTYDCGAAGITITPSRAAKNIVFSDTYFTSIQYVICKSGDFTADGTDGDVSYVLWDSLAGKKLGVQLDTTGDIYVSDEIDGGVLDGSGATCTQYDNVQSAVAALNASQLNAVVVDKLPAEYIVKNDNSLVCFALYYAGEEGGDPYPTQEDYAICVTKGNDELLNAINEVLKELGEDGINRLVNEHLGLN